MLNAERGTKNMKEDELTDRTKTQVNAQYSESGMGETRTVPHSEFRIAPCGLRTSQRSKQKILIVDDRKENLITLRQVLRDVNAELIEATTGNQALAATLDHDFALAILDVQMPGMNGYELAEHLRGDEKTRTMPIIFVTAAQMDEESVFKGYESGGIDYILKPFSPQALLGKVRRFLELDRYTKHLDNMVQERTATVLHLNRVLSGIRHVNQLIVREKDPVRLIMEANRGLAETRGFHGVWIALVDDEGNLKDLTGYGYGEVFGDFKQRFEKNWRPTCCSAALRQQGSVVTENPLEDCSDCPLSAAHGCAKVGMSVALEHAGKHYGFMRVGLPEDVDPGGEEESLLQEVAGDIAYALYGIEQEEKRRRAEGVLRQSEEKYRNLFESSRDGIAFSNMEGNVIDANQAFLDMIGYREEELRKLTYQKLTPEKWHDMERDILEKQILARGYSSEYEKEYIRKDGSVFPVAVTVWLTKDEQMSPSGMWALVRDMSEHKLIEQQRIMTEKMTALGTLTAGVAHELNNPMMGMLNFTQYCLKKTSEDDPRYDLLQDTERETKRCIEIVKSLLTFSRMDRGGAEAYHKENIATLCNRVLSLLSYRIKQDNVSVLQHIAQDTPAVPMSASGMQQVFLNLIGNSLDALAEHAKKEIHIDIHPSADSVEVIIADSGSGIASENLQQIFDPFFTTKPVGKGTGLGLSVSRSIVEAHRGKITCESQVGKGTKFIIRLPIKKD